MAKRATKTKASSDDTILTPEQVYGLFKQLISESNEPASVTHKKKEHEPNKVSSSTLADDLMLQAVMQHDSHKAHEFARKSYELNPKNPVLLGMLTSMTRNLFHQLKYAEEHAELIKFEFLPKDLSDLEHGTKTPSSHLQSYLKVRMQVAHLLWQLHRWEEAIAIAQEALRADKRDELFASEILCLWLMNAGKWQELKVLVESLSEERSFTIVRYTRALVSFKETGDSPAARKLLKHARKENKYVPPLILGSKPITETEPQHPVTDEDEAHFYAQKFRFHWVNTPGALLWLSDQTTRPPRKTGTGATAEMIQRLNELPQANATWIIEYRPIPQYLKIGTRLTMPWHLVILDTTDGYMLGAEVFPGEPQADEIWDVLAKFILNPLRRGVTPVRPKVIVGLMKESYQLLRNSLRECGIEINLVEEIPPLDNIYADMTSMVCKDELELAAIPKIEGITKPVLEKFYQAATDFYRQTPWIHTIYERAIEIHAPSFRREPYYVTVMGNLGVVPGFSLYPTSESISQLLN